MTRRGISVRAETFGFNTGDPWAVDLFRLLFNVPRAYAPLVEAWDLRYPGSKKALHRLVSTGFVAYQPGLIVDTRTGSLVEREGRKLSRWRITAKGRRALAEFSEDMRTFEDKHPRITPDGARSAVRLLAAFHLDDSYARFGISTPHAVEVSGMQIRLARWWMEKFSEDGYITELSVKIADTREVVPAHWRINKLLCRQLSDVLDEYGPAYLKSELRVSRSKFLGDIDPARIGITGATDYDHDVESQRIVAAVMKSNSWSAGGVFSVEPRIVLPMDDTGYPWSFDASGGNTSFYQPDAEFRGTELSDGRSRSRRYVVEYERFQSRRDAWTHIERFVGYMHTRALRDEPGTLLFVVDGESRRRGYVQLVEAFADHVGDHPNLAVSNPITLAVSSVDRVLNSNDPLDVREWSRIELPIGADTGCKPVLHQPESSPYDAYFGRG
jgi:hypothetical protein